MQRDDPYLPRTPRDEPYNPEPPLGLPGDKSLNSETELWLYIGKGLLIMAIGAIVITNAMYGLFEVLVWLAD
jgi:hypothetical protein